MSTAAIPVTVAIVDDTKTIDAAELASVAGALSEQIQHDFAPIWHVRASVVAAPQASPNQWVVHIQEQLDQPGALGYHTNEHNQPVSFVMKTDDWAITVSHETLEMLADPWGNRMHQGRAPDGTTPDQFELTNEAQRVHYLLEVCDPPEATSYEVGGVKLSDFLLPGWYRTSPLVAPAYSHAGGCTAPRQVADGGYVSFANDDSVWWQVFNQNGSLSVRKLGKFNRERFASLREFSDHHAREYRA